MRRRIVSYCLRRCERIFAPSSSIVERLRSAGVGGSCVFTNGVPEVPMSQGIEARVPTVLWAARFSPIKDPMILVRVVAKLRDRGLSFRVILAGSATPNHAWYADEVARAIREYRLEQVIQVTGWVDDPADLYREAAIGVQTSHFEGLSMTLLEQMMAGLAIVATDVGDTRVAVDQQTGLLIAPMDEAQLASALEQVISDVSLRKRLGDSARQRALTHFSLDAMARQVFVML
jgi:glycosyltransferase involved in cell wall biosynthesis